MRHKLLERITKYVVGLHRVEKTPRKLKDYYYSPSFKSTMLRYAINDFHGTQDLNRIKEYILKSLIQSEPTMINQIPDASDQLKMTAVGKNGNSISGIENPTEEMQITAVTAHPESIQYIEDPSEEVQMIAISDNPMMIKHIKKPADQVVLKAVNQKIECLKYIDYSRLSDDILFNITLIL